MLMQELAEPAGIALSWMLTYLIHSTILVLAVWLICRGIRPLARRVGPGAENLGWKLALLGGFATATVQVAAGVTPALGALELETGPALVEQQALESQPRQALRERSAVGAGVIPGDEEPVMLGAGPLPPASQGPTPEAAAAIEAGPAPLWPGLVLGAWFLGVLIALGRLAASIVALRRRLEDRREVIEDPVLEAFLTLCRDADIRRKIRLTQSANIGSPLALWRREVVVPERAVEELSPVAMRSVLAHELAHLERRDPHWLAFAAVIEALFFFQPLNRLARRGMQESAELLCDDWAIARTGDGVQFAKSLAELASWAKASHAPELGRGLVATMISGERPLVRRVRRALDGDPRRFNEDEGPRPTRVLLGIGTLAALIMVAPGAVDASPPTGERSVSASAESRRQARAERETTAAREEAEQAAQEAIERARAAQREAEQAQREAERLAASARRSADAVGSQHFIIRDGEDYLIIDEQGVRMRAEGAEVDILDGANPRMRVRVHEDEVDFDLEVDLDTLEDMAEMFLGGGGGFAPGAPGAPFPPGAAPTAPQGFEGFEGFEGFDAWGEALERELLEELEGERQRRAPTPPRPAPAVPVPVAPAPAPAPLIPA